MPMLRYPMALAAAKVDPEPANGSKINPFLSGSAALMTVLKNA